jgi:hypothetical protein
MCDPLSELHGELLKGESLALAELLENFGVQGRGGGVVDDVFQSYAHMILELSRDHVC